MAMLEVKNLCAFYGKAQALSDVSISVEQGETIAIVGANGAGKSTLIKSLVGSIPLIDGERLAGNNGQKDGSYGARRHRLCA